MEMTPFLEVTDLTFRYFEQSKHNILNHVSLTVANKKTTVFIGPGGCGKSTLAAVCAGLYPENGGYLEGGQIRLLGQPLETLKPSRRAPLLSLLFQNPDLQFCMDTLRNELYFCMENLSISPGEMDDRVTALAGEMNLGPLLDRKLHTLSGGEKQKAALCCLFALGSRGLFLDEPFANIDGSSARQIIELLQSRKKTDGLTILAIDHKLDNWLELADEFVILGTGGQVLQRGITPSNLADYEELFQEQGIFFPRRLSRSQSRDGGDAAGNTTENTAEDAVADMARNTAIALTGLSIFQAGKAAPLLLEEVHASFESGTITAILGPSGAGKTSLFYTLLGRRPYTGSIMIHGRELKTIKPGVLYQELGMAFQNPGSQFITQNVLEEVSESLRLWNRKEDPEALLGEFHLETYKKYSPYMLSQGQQRRLAVLSMIAGGQKILLLDEPTYGQDERSARALMELLANRVEQNGLTVILITHDEELAAWYAHRCYRLTDRRLLPVTLSKTPNAILEKGENRKSWNN